MTNFFTEKFSWHLKQSLLRAHGLALTNKSKTNFLPENSLNNKSAEINDSEHKTEVSPQNLLDSLKYEQGSIAAEILNKNRNNSYALKSSDVNLPLVSKPNSISVRLNQEASEIIIKAIHTSNEYGHKYVGTEHMLKSLAESKNKNILAWWQKENINVLNLEKNLRIVMESTSKFPDLTAVFNAPDTANDNKEKDNKSALAYFGRELTDKIVQKNIDPLIGRQREVNRLIQILCRRHKNNPMLLGEAGVGKTAIVEGLAKKISQGDVPPILANKKIYTVDLGSVVAGTVYRGEFEARLKNLIETAEVDGNTILFIDEIHTIIGAGSASGSLDAANMLKPALARGQISVIGATTLEEYKKHIETDSALERRFQVILVEEPNENETREVLQGIKANYEKFHTVDITPEAIATAVRLSNRYITDKLQPDKSIDLIDEAAAKAKVARSQKSIWHKIKQLERQIEQIALDKKSAVQKEEYALAIDLKNKEEELNKSLNGLLIQANNQNTARSQITPEHILEVVSSLTKIPLGELQKAEKQMFTDLEKNLREKIIGQDKALSSIADLIRRSRTNISDPNKPLASFIFLGPSGVGKTETAKQMALILFNDKKALIRVDMSEFAEGFTVSRLIGAPAGYVGYRDSNKFTDEVRRRPYCVILLDEIEKAHPEVFNVLLQILEDGFVTDATGRRVNFKNTIMVMTSNLGLEEFNRAARLGFADSEEEESKDNFKAVEKNVTSALKKHFRPEFLNRLDKVVVFNPLSKENLEEIVKLYLNELNNRLKENNILVELNNEAIKHIAKLGFAPEYGARGIRRVFQESIESEIAKIILRSESPAEKKIRVGVDQDKFNLSLQ